MSDLIMYDLKGLQDDLADGASPARIMAKLLHVVVSQQKEIQKLQEELRNLKREVDFLRTCPI